MNDVADRLARYMIVSSLMELRMMSADPSSDDNLSYRDVLYLNLISGMEECTVSKLADAACVTSPRSPSGSTASSDADWWSASPARPTGASRTSCSPTVP